MGCEAIEKDERDLLIAIDRSKGKKITLYSIAVSSTKVKDELIKYIDTFKHVKFLSRRERAIYFPKALRVIKALVDTNILLSVDVTNYLGVLLDHLEKISNRVLIAVADDYLVGIVKSRLRESVVIAEGSLRRHRATLESLELKPSMMYVLIGIADTLVAYTRIQVEDHGKRLKEVRTRLPLKWNL
ncbi:MAG: hypothetical protein GSR85_02495 [Desulfurococcales archaeon]|nr:hypothetical protein [Desulfurococcales archaeon]